MRRLILWPVGVVVVLLVALLAWFVSGGVGLFGDLDGYTAKRHGTLVESTLERTVPRGATHETRYYRLVSSSGLQVEIALRRPVRDPGQPLPLVVLIDGFKHGRDAVDRLGETGDTILATVSYPYAGDRGLKRMQWIGASREIRRALHDAPAAVMLVLDFALRQPDVDPRRVELIGVSLGSPLACVAGALDDRVTRVWSLHGGGGTRLIWDNVLSRGIRSRVLRRPLVELLSLLTRRIDPLAYVGRIAPRELVVVGGRDDAIFPQASSDVLYERAGEPKERIWTDTPHVNPQRPELIRELMALVIARIQQ